MTLRTVDGKGLRKEVRLRTVEGKGLRKDVRLRRSETETGRRSETESRRMGRGFKLRQTMSKRGRRN